MTVSPPQPRFSKTSEPLEESTWPQVQIATQSELDAEQDRHDRRCIPAIAIRSCAGYAARG